MQEQSFTRASFITKLPTEEVRAAAGAFPFPNVHDHETELQELVRGRLDWRTIRKEVLNLMYIEDGHHLFYFYCHGADQEGVFALQVGPAGGAHNTITADNIQRKKVHWGTMNIPQPLVILIACDSLALQPEIMSDFLTKLKSINAFGVIGCEIATGMRLGRQWGKELIAALVDGRSVGQAFLQMRRDLLRRCNPLGLVFTAYAPATLHICTDPGGAKSCKQYHLHRGELN